ncbi:MAG TPA: prolyl oligopeptidase family serine peptidase [Gemmataceae bacterium]|nr:prolyl oligopeptidase family serine peptidase [Gemmataceae bacterium]
MRTIHFAQVIALFLLPGLATAADPPKMEPPAPVPGEKLIQAYFQRQAREIADADLKDYPTRADWEKARPELRRQLLEMLGLWPLPPHTDLKAEITGKIERPTFTVEKLVFQSMPGLYVTANLYVPKPAPTKAPTILYVCGHGNVVKDGVSYGSKTFYQHHPGWYAEHGYVALILDTLQLSEIPGLHHGTYRDKMWWWHTLGYTPAGVECWNGMRALDYLESRPEVDLKRIGVTGRSGGGAYSWWIAATDERIACAVPVAGIADLQAHLNEGYPGRLEKGVIAGHCDCMFMTNTYRWDFSKVAALLAPRPLMLGNSDRDDIFPVPGFRRIEPKVQRIYDLYGAGNKFIVYETLGKHEDTPELRLGEYRWMNRWLKGDDASVVEEKFDRFEPQQLKVLDKTPEGQLNTTIQDLFIKPANIELPKSADVIKEWWPGEKAKLETALREKVFRGWPAKVPDLAVKPAGDKTHDGVRLRAWDFTSEEGFELRLWLMTSGDARPSLVVLNALDEAEWTTWCADLGPEFADLLQLAKPPKRDEAKFKQNRAVMEKQKWAFAAVCPRGIGPTKWAEPGTSNDVQYRRRFVLVGQTLDGMRVWDVRRAFQALKAHPELKGTPIWLQGKHDMAGVALYAAIYEPEVARLDLWHLPPSHANGPTLLNVRKYLDTPQALALAFPRPVKMYVNDADAAKAWSWTLDLQKALAKEYVQVRVVGD